ncbi:MAG: metallophosphoesterase [Oribacterium sp.]|nr:metallophosphoesterase [Oribacterium sp.]
MRTLSESLLIIFLTFILTGCSAFAKKSPEGSHAANASDMVVVTDSVKADPVWSDPEVLHALIISDIHYTERESADHLNVPGIALSGEFTDAIVEEVIAKNPDVFIVTGDNTNSGASEDVAGLTARLKRIKDAGIPLVITTGNHDFDLMDEDEYEKAYFGLLDPVDRDPASLSYTYISKDVVLLAMDDKALSRGAQSEFSPETMGWIREMLEKYKGKRIIFLSHHNVLYNSSGKETATNIIHNDDLAETLIKGGVKLCITGHMHSQYILEKDGLWEVLSGMPFSGKHLMGNLAVGKDRILYYAEPLELGVYGKEVSEKLRPLEEERDLYMDKVFSELLDSEGLNGQKKDGVKELIFRFFDYYEEGSLADHRPEIMADPNYKTMLDALWDHNYGPWMKEMAENTKYSGRQLEINL